MSSFEKYTFIICVPLLGAFNNILGYIRAVLLGDLDDSIPALNSIFYVFGYAAILCWQQYVMKWDFSVEYSFLRTHGWKGLLYAAIFNIAAQIMSFFAQPYITPVVNAILSQILVPVLMVLSAFVFKTRYIFLEILGVVLIITADIITSVVSVNSKSEMRTDIWVIFWMIMSSVCQGFSWVYKERVFRDFKAQHNRTILLFPALVLNQIFGMLSVIPLLWVTETLRGTNFWDHMAETLYALSTTNIVLSYSLYIIFNLAFNISIYRLLALSTSVLPFISLKFQLPLVALFSMFNWPFIGRKTPSAWNLFELTMLLIGISFYLYGGVIKKKLKELHPFESLCCWMGFFTVTQVSDQESIPLLSGKESKLA